MTGRTMQWSVIVSLCVLVAGCDKGPSGSANKAASKPSASAGQRVEVGLRRDLPDWGRVSLKVVAVHTNQAPTKAAPWHKPGGDWTYIELADPAGRVAATIGMQQPADADQGFSEGVVAVNDPAAGKAFFDLVARQFHSRGPSPRQGDAPLLLPCVAVELGKGLSEHPESGFTDTPAGEWNAYKLMFDTEGGHSEVYFNYNSRQKSAELVERDPELREDLLAQMAAAFRDGPLPPRTPQIDPSFSLVGPKVTRWQPLPHETQMARFTHDGSRLLFVTWRQGQQAQLHVAPSDDLAAAKVVTTFSGVAVPSPLPGDASHALVQEILPAPDNAAPKQRLWLVDLGNGNKKELTGPWGQAGMLVSDAVSPDGRFVRILEAMSTTDRGKQPSYFVFDLQQWKAVKVDAPAALAVGPWRRQSGPARSLMVTLEDLGENQKWYEVDPLTGKLSSLAKAPPEADEVALISPDGTKTARVAPHERLTVADAAGSRTLAIHEYDRAYAKPDSFTWVSPRYMLFEGRDRLLIDTQTMKTSLVDAPDSKPYVTLYAPDMRHAIGEGNEGMHLGSVEVK